MRLLRAPARIAIFIAFMLIVTACGTQEVPSGSDWCFRFYFKYDTYGAAISRGEFVEYHGIQTDNEGFLSMSYNQPLIVVPTAVVVKVTRGEGITGDIDFAASGAIFGMTTGGATVNRTMPGVDESAEVVFIPPNAGDGSSSFNFTVQASQQVLLEEMEVYGNGASPFEDYGFGCFDTPPYTITPVPSFPVPTSSGTPVTPTPSDTPTPSNTPTPTFTPTISPTPTQTVYCEHINFSGADDLDWVYFPNPYGQGDYSIVEGGYDGPAFQSGEPGILSGYYQSEGTLGIDVSNLTGITSMSWWVRAVGSGTNLNAGNGYLFAGTWDSTIGSVATPNFNFPGSEWQLKTLNDMSVEGYSMLTIDYYVPTDAETGSGYQIQLDAITICHTGYVTTPTPTNTPTPTLTTTPPTFTLTPPPIGTLTNPPPGTGTRTATATRTPSRTIVPINTVPPQATFPPPATAWSTVTAHPTYTAQMTWTVAVELTMSATYGGTGTPAGTGTPYNIPWATIMPGGGDDGEGGSGRGGIVGYGNGLLAFGQNAMNQGFAWLGELRFWSTRMITNFQDATPMPLPGLPQCTSNRLASELCAIYYILTYTVLSGPVGSLIVPIGVINLDIFIFFSFILLARAIIVRLAEILRQ